MAEQLKALIAISASLTGAIIGWMAVLKPLMGLRRERKAQRQRAVEETLKAETEYRQTVLDLLEGLGSRMTTMDDSIADLQRDNIERAYCMFKLEHGYCPSGMKESIASTYSSYKARGYNHIAGSRIEELLALPEFPEK